MKGKNGGKRADRHTGNETKKRRDGDMCIKMRDR